MFNVEYKSLDILLKNYKDFSALLFPVSRSPNFLFPSMPLDAPIHQSFIAEASKTNDWSGFFFPMPNTKFVLFCLPALAINTRGRIIFDTTEFIYNIEKLLNASKNFDPQFNEFYLHESLFSNFVDAAGKQFELSISAEVLEFDLERAFQNVPQRIIWHYEYATRFDI